MGHLFAQGTPLRPRLPPSLRLPRFTAHRCISGQPARRRGGRLVEPSVMLRAFLQRPQNLASDPRGSRRLQIRRPETMLVDQYREAVGVRRRRRRLPLPQASARWCCGTGAARFSPPQLGIVQGTMPRCRTALKARPQHRGYACESLQRAPPCPQSSASKPLISSTVSCSPPTPAACELYTSDFSQGRTVEPS